MLTGELKERPGSTHREVTLTGGAQREIYTLTGSTHTEVTLTGGTQRKIYTLTGSTHRGNTY